MTRLSEAWKSARSRLSPEGLLVSGAIASVSPFIITPAQVAITASIHELGNSLDPTALGILAIGTVALMNTASVLLENETLKKKKFSNSPISSTLNMAIGMPAVTSAIVHAGHIVTGAIANPVSVLSIPALFSGEERLLIENITAVNIAIGLWNIGFNSLILTGRVDPAVRFINRVKNKIRHKPLQN